MLMPVCGAQFLRIKVRGRRRLHLAQAQTALGQWLLTHEAGVIEDAKFKRREALADLAAAVSKGTK